MVNMTDPGLILAAPPAPELLQIFPIPRNIGPLRDPPAFRNFVVGLLRTYNGFGCGEITSGDKPPKGRPKAYGYLLFPFVRDKDNALDYSSTNCIPGRSSCGLTVRSLWMLLGARHPLLNGPDKYGKTAYQGGVMTYVRAFAILHGAYRGMEDTVISTGRKKGLIAPNEGVDSDGKTIMPEHLTWDTFDPKPGDVLFMESTQHMSTIVKITAEKDEGSVGFICCDGGQATPGDGKCCGISLINRKVMRNGEKSTTSKMFGDTFTDSSGKQVRGWADITKLTFAANFYTIARNPGRLNLPDPKPIGQ